MNNYDMGRFDDINFGLVCFETQTLTYAYIKL